MSHKPPSICCGPDARPSSIASAVGFVRAGLLCTIDRCVMDLKLELAYLRITGTSLVKPFYIDRHSHLREWHNKFDVRSV